MVMISDPNVPGECWDSTLKRTTTASSPVPYSSSCIIMHVVETWNLEFKICLSLSRILLKYEHGLLYRLVRLFKNAVPSAYIEQEIIRQLAMVN
jgi:hypothetical protein